MNSRAASRPGSMIVDLTAKDKLSKRIELFAASGMPVKEIIQKYSIQIFRLSSIIPFLVFMSCYYFNDWTMGFERIVGVYISILAVSFFEILAAFTEHYQKWCKRKGYNFQPDKPAEIYEAVRNIIPVLPKDEVTKFIVRQAVNQINTASAAVEDLRTRMNDIASQLPEYPAVLAMKGVGTSLGPQLMAEIGDVTRFTHKGALIAFAGVDPGKNESGSYAQKSVHTSKRGSAPLRKTLFQIMDSLIKTMPQGDPVYEFMNKKRSQGKPYYVYMTAGADKFLRVYYGCIKEYLSAHPEAAEN